MAAKRKGIEKRRALKKKLKKQHEEGLPLKKGSKNMGQKAKAFEKKLLT